MVCMECGAKAEKGYTTRALKNSHFFSGSFLSFIHKFIKKHAKRILLYCVANSVSLVILLLLATNAVKYICNSIANNPLESALRNP